ncbi:HU family DNA-binding protein [Thalassobius sp. I31.1]|uniref:HU family DNA-binding protein n=1 Tax=Thalassobius sp. I31.1 TaxID=2109912 RepID=UPI000D1A49A9|nr:HU family DNA-binding protein [Thalassobius sp. I31.1]
MKKSELIAAIAKAGQTSNADAERSLIVLADVVRTALESGQKVTLPEIGTFSTKERKARKGRNPRTGEAIDVPAKTVAHFKPTPSLADLIA